MARRFMLVAVVGTALALAACFGPSDQRPGMHLSGKTAPLPADWLFSAAYQEIQLEVSGFLGLPHSVTIWCATLDGALYVGALDPETKHWTRWVDADPNVRLKMGEVIYEVHLTPLDDAAAIARLQEAYAAKYHLPPLAPNAKPRHTRYWRVGPRS